MNRALFTAASGLTAQQLSLDVISNNLANASTTGFKKARANFEDLIYQQLRDPGAPASNNSTLPTGMQIGLGVSAGTTSVSFSQGTPQSTGGDFDMAINGQGFFKVQMPDGTFAYTRSGNFAVDSQGKLVTAEGLTVIPEVTVPKNYGSFSVGAGGQVTVTNAGSSTQSTLGTLNISLFPNPAGLKNIGSNLYVATSASGTATDAAPGATGAGVLIHKSVESSNVDIVEEMVHMIILQRTSDKKLLKEAIAYDPQGSLADIVNRALLHLWKMNIAIIMFQDHDALTFMYPERDEERILPILRDNLVIPIPLAGGRTLRIPFDCETGWNKGHWHPEKNPDGLKEYEGLDNRKRSAIKGLLDRTPSRVEGSLKLLSKDWSFQAEEADE